MREAELKAFLESEEWRRRAAYVLDRLDPREADMVQLHYLQAVPQAEVARRFGVTQAQVSFRLDRCIERIKQLLLEPLP